ncbi:hypothetical protein AX15_001247 [Amanita polypyramis BW_CC]|nr:hypothetical protein AX15_001247 [Amanita polypyramis BW_CC]
MKAFMSRTASIGAGRQLPASVLNLLHVHLSDDSRSPVRRRGRRLTKRRRCLADANPSQVKTVGFLGGLMVFKQWRDRVAKNTNNLLSLGLDAEAQELKDLHHAACIVAFKQENEKVRLALKGPALLYCSSEELDEVFPSTLQYISKAYMEEVSDSIWEELVAEWRK